MALAVGTAAVSDDAARSEEVGLNVFSTVESVFSLWAFSDDLLGSALDAPLESEDLGVDSVTLALAELVVDEAALGTISR